MNLSRASLISLILGSGLVTGMEGTHSATPSDRLGATRGSDSKVRLRRTVLKGQAALPSSTEDDTIREGTGSVRQRMLKKMQNKYPAKQPASYSGTDLKMVSTYHGQGHPGDWEATVEEMADALREAKTNKYKDECGAACKKCWIALGGQIDDVVFNLQRMTHLTSQPWYQVSFCSADLAVCKSAFDFMLTNAGLGLLELSQHKQVPVAQSLCSPLNSGLNAFIFNCNKQEDEDTKHIAQSLETCKDDTVTLNPDLRAKCATAFDFLGGDISVVKTSLDSAMALYEKKYSGPRCEENGRGQGYGVLFCPNGESKNLLRIQSVIQALNYLSMTKLNEEHFSLTPNNEEEYSRIVAEYPWMTYWMDSGRSALNGPRAMTCDNDLFF